jgi:hypothetical protein
VNFDAERGEIPMRRNLIAVLGILATACGLGGIARADDTASPIPESTPAAPAPLRSDGPLPAHYAGEDIKALHAALALTKGEFETTKDFDARVAQAAPAMTGLRAFPVSPEALAPFKYNADKERFESTLRTRRAIDLDQGRGRRVGVLPVDEETVSKGTHRASNAYGTTVDVKEIESTVYGLNPEGRAATDYPTIYVPMSPEQARNAKANLAALFVCELASPPHAGKAFDSFTPTIDTPVESVTRMFYVNVRHPSVWVYDQATGEVYVRRPLD